MPVSSSTPLPTDDATIQSLIERGRAAGNRLGIEALGDALPTETMTPEEVAAVVERLESAGIEVDLDDSRLTRPRGAPAGDYRRGDGVVDIASPAAPAVSAPGAVPTRHGWADDLGTPGAHDDHGAAPRWTHDGMELLPLASIAAVAVVMIVALGH